MATHNVAPHNPDPAPIIATASAALRVFLLSLPRDEDSFDDDLSDVQVAARGISDLLQDAVAAVMENTVDRGMGILYAARFAGMAEGALWNACNGDSAAPSVPDVRLTLEQALRYLERTEDAEASA